METSIQVGILSNCGASVEEVKGPEVSLLKLAISGTIKLGARRIRPHWETQHAGSQKYGAGSG
jgi:hypothetical protein